MTTLLPGNPEELDLNPEEIEIALQSTRTLSRLTPTKEGVHFRLHQKGHREEVVLPAPVFKFLLEMMTQLTRGKSFLMVPIQAELTTQEGADILGVSRPFLINLLDEGKLPFRKVGKHRRILGKDIMEFQQSITAQRQKSLDALAAQAQELEMGY